MAVIKSMTRKTESYRQLIEYFLRDQKNGASKSNSFILRHNLQGTNIEQWIKEFRANESNRQVKRKDSTRIYHEVYSISTADKSKVSLAMLKDLASKYIALRAPNGLCIAVAHFAENAHIHFMFGGVEIETGRALRISKEEFARFKQELQEYEKKRYPELSHSVVAHGKKQKGKAKANEKEYQLTRRTKAPSHREQIKRTMEVCYNKSLSHADFMYRLSEAGLKASSRTGIEREGRKYSFGSLGYDEKKLGELNIREDAIKGMQVFRDEQNELRQMENPELQEREREYDRIATQDVNEETKTLQDIEDNDQQLDYEIEL